jgi:septum formation protein
MIAKGLTITLASASPRRRDLLAQIGIEAIVVPSSADEEEITMESIIADGILPEEAPGELARRRAAHKASGATAATGTAGLLAADTIVTIDGESLEKPADREDARRMLRLLSGRCHTVITGVAFRPAAGSAAERFIGGDGAPPPISPSVPPSPSAPLSPPIPPSPSAPSSAGEMIVEAPVTEVTFAPLSDSEIERYLDTGEWNGVAGGYRIQGHAGAFVTHLSGSYTSVMGLPLGTVYSIIKRFSGFDSGS